jgi:hypothetical protein
MMQNTPSMHSDLAAGNKENDDGELEEGEIIEDNNFDSVQEAKNALKHQRTLMSPGKETFADVVSFVVCLFGSFFNPLLI